MTRKAIWPVLASATWLLASGMAQADNTANVKHPLWFKEPSAYLQEKANLDDLSDIVVGEGPFGEEGVLYSDITVSDEQLEKIRAGNFTVAIALGWLGDDWAQQQLAGMREEFERLGIKIIAETNANWRDAQQISDLATVSVLQPDLVVSFPLNAQTTASAYKELADAGTKIVFMDQVAEGLEPGKGYVSMVSSDNHALGMNIADMLSDAIGGSGKVAAMYYAPDFYVTNVRYEGFIARMRAKHPEVELVASIGHNGPDRGQEVAQGLFARYPDLDGLYGSWSIPAMGAVTAASVAGIAPTDLRIVNENFDHIVAANMAQNGYIAGISAQNPYLNGITEARLGALALIGEEVPPFVVIPPIKVTRDNLTESYKRIYRQDAPAEITNALSN
ncbi:sugar ABC transporter substrate-binding protein [Paracoccus subflavus]|uniref:Sugar ABC transporter substrate-binding protein n=1 Tax=Paracoccus subflavus TaxID=2528244 RepID=A0A4V2JC79_9RHOB|nr:substrate-binding domain-containing protein [Paracoccus subflavus]TBN39930.1 sugar ABC transporter substrate-binding protein [Paracoccus subflavus]